MKMVLTSEIYFCAKILESVESVLFKTICFWDVFFWATEKEESNKIDVVT